MRSGSKGCQVVIVGATSETRDVTSHYKLWEAFMAVRGICVRNNRDGYATLLGRSSARVERETASLLYIRTDE